METTDIELELDCCLTGRLLQELLLKDSKDRSSATCDMKTRKYLPFI